MIIRKIFEIFVKICIGLFAFYLFFTLAAVPLLSPWLIKSQASKFLKTPISVRGVYLNPFYFRFHIIGLEVLNTEKRKLVAFDRFIVDVSFRDLFKKIIHIESVKIEGLFVHATLMKDGQIDILKLVPASAQVEGKPEEQKSPAAMPIVMVDEITFKNARIQFDDLMVQPVFTTALNQIELSIQGFSTVPDTLTSIDFKAVLDEKGIIGAQAQLKPLAQPLELELNFGLDQYILPVTTPYVGKYTGRGLVDGTLDFNTTYRISNNKLTASHKILIQRFTFGEKVDSKDALNLPFGFAVALLEDPQGRIIISLPVEGELNDPKFKYSHLIWQTVRNFFMKLVTKPFSVLGSMLGSDSGTDELGYVKFVPGKSDLTPEEEAKLLFLAKAFKERPRLLLEINGSYDFTHDWKAIKVDQFNKDLAALEKETSKDENWVMQTLYQRRFGMKQLWKLTKAFKTKAGYDYEKLNAEIKRHLGEDAFPDKAALNALAEERAKTIYNILLKEHVDPRRVKIGISHEVQSSMGFVLLEFTLTVFE